MNISFSDKQLHWLFFVLPTIAILFGITVYFLAGAKNAENGIYDNVYEKLIEARVLYSPECITYVDNNGRTHTGVIDLKKLTPKNIRDCITLNKKNQPEFIIEVMSAEYKKYEEITKSYKSANWNTKSKTRKLVTNEYPVQIYGRGPGKITFTYRW